MITRTAPIGKYNGVTFILSHPGRFDIDKCCGGPARRLVDAAMTTTGTKSWCCDFRTLGTNIPLLPDTRVVILMGPNAAGVVGYSADKLARIRGTPIERDGITYIATFHPQDAADRQNYESKLNPESPDYGNEEETDTEGQLVTKDYGKTSRANYNFWVTQDIKKAFRILRSGRRVNTCSYEVVSNHEAIPLLHSVTPDDTLFLDIETNPETCRMISFAWSTGAQRVYATTFFNPVFAATTEPAMLARILKALAGALDRAKRVVCHNASFDLFILAWQYKLPPPAQGKIYDTMVAHHRINIGVEKSLGHCGSLYTDQPYHKDEGIFTPSNAAQLKQLLHYNAKDVELTALVYEEQCRIASRMRGLADSIAQGNEIIRPLLFMTLQGMPLNTDYLCKVIDEHRAKATLIEKRVLPLFNDGKPFNPRSPKQVAGLLYDTYGLPKPGGEGTGTDAKSLHKIAAKYPLPALRAILMTKRIGKVASQLSFKLWNNERVTCGFTTAKVKTFRLSSTKLLDHFGTNVQNWPKKLRKVVQAPPGYEFGQVDQSGAEALVVAHCCPAGRYRALFDNGIKVHSYVAMHLFQSAWEARLGHPIREFLDADIAQLSSLPGFKDLMRLIRSSDDWAPHERYYFMGKQTAHSSNYGVGPFEFVMNLLDKSDGQVFITTAEAERFLNIYHRKLFPEIECGYQAFVRKSALQTGILYNCFGFPRIILDPEDRREESTKIKDYYSWIPQSTVGIITCKAHAELQSRLDSGEYKGFELLTNTHDSLLFMCEEGEAIKHGRTVQAHMNQELTSPYDGHKFKMASGLSIGKNWYEMAEL